MADKVYSMDELAWVLRLEKRSDAVRLCQRKEIRWFRRHGCYYVWETAILEYVQRINMERKRPAYAGT